MTLEVKLIALLSLVLAFAGVGMWGQYEHLAAVKAKAEVQTLKTQNQGLQTALDAAVEDGHVKDAVNLAKQLKINKLAVKAAQNQKALDAALKENRAWADTRVPDSVWDAIAPAETDQAKARSRVDSGSTRPGSSGP